MQNMLGRCPSRSNALWPPLLQALPAAHGRAIPNRMPHVSRTTFQQTRPGDVRRVEKRSRHLGSQSRHLLPANATGGSGWKICSRSRLAREHESYDFPPAFHDLPVSNQSRELVAGFCGVYDGADAWAVEGCGFCFGDWVVFICADVVGHEEQHVCIKPCFGSSFGPTTPLAESVGI
jgi:hypothetical protein